MTISRKDHSWASARPGRAGKQSQAARATASLCLLRQVGGGGRVGVQNAPHQKCHFAQLLRASSSPGWSSFVETTRDVGEEGSFIHSFSKHRLSPYCMPASFQVKQVSHRAGGHNEQGTDKSAGTAGIAGMCPAGEGHGLFGDGSQLCLSPEGPLSFRGLLCKMVLLLCSQAAVAAGRHKDGRGWGLHAWPGCPRVLLDNVCILDLLSSPPAHKPSCTPKGDRNLLPKRDFFCIAVPASPLPTPLPQPEIWP